MRLFLGQILSPQSCAAKIIAGHVYKNEGLYYMSICHKHAKPGSIEQACTLLIMSNVHSNTASNICGMSFVMLPWKQKDKLWL